MRTFAALWASCWRRARKLDGVDEIGNSPGAIQRRVALLVGGFFFAFRCDRLTRKLVPHLGQLVKRPM